MTALHQKRRRFWIDATVQLQIMGYVMALVTASLLLTTLSVRRGLAEASQKSNQIFHSLEWVERAMSGPLAASALLCTLAGALITLLWSHRFAGPLRLLSTAMGRIGEGDFSSRLRVRRSDALIAVVEDFARMQEDLRAMLAEDHKRIDEIRLRLSEISQNLPEKHSSRSEIEELLILLQGVASRYKL